MFNRIFVNMKRHFPATHVILPSSCEGRRAAFYLAVEEYVAEELPADSYFFTWQIGPTVVMGRNQVAHQEVNLDFCRKEGIDVIRRRSGGGAIFADERNIMTSLITEDSPVESLFQEYAEAVADTLRKLGAPALVSGRNDIIIKSKAEETGNKVCGNAFYKKANRCIAHGTMLYDTNPQLMEGALHPDINKLESKGVKSVRSRIGLLKDYLDFGVEELRKQLQNMLCDHSVSLTTEDVRHIEELEQRYYLPDYLYGTSNHADIIRKGRIEGVGTLEIRIQLNGSLIGNIELNGDYFAIGNAQTALNDTLFGIPYTPEAVSKAIYKNHPESFIRGLSARDLLTILNN